MKYRIIGSIVVIIIVIVAVALFSNRESADDYGDVTNSEFSP
jgi:hypothetical protein